MREDTDVSLGSIRQEIGRPIYSALLEVQKYSTAEAMSVNWIRSLELLYMKSDRIKNLLGPSSRHSRGNMQLTSGRLLGRTYINPLAPRNYIAVSYLWNPAPGEDHSRGGYLVESSTPRWKPSLVRDVVWDRVSKFAAYIACPYFWVDRECINQKNKNEKEVALQSMHLVYRHSDHPVALLTKRIVCPEQLDLLAALLSGSLVFDDEDTAPDLRLNPDTLGSAGRVLKLLGSITSDQWWTRAWPFQEDYCAATNMTLLIPHDASLEDQKWGAKATLFGDLEGELCVNSANFREEASRFCLAYKNERQGQGRLEEMAGRILQRAGKYTVTLQDRQAQDNVYAVRRSMSPSIFADVGARKAGRCSDRLAIVANCCDYSERLNTKKLQSSNLSLSLALLTLYLLNGEILMNGRGGGGSGSDIAPLNSTIFDFLKTQSLSNFSSPVRQQLTFIKSCRLVRVKLVEEGMQTQGHLWQLGPTILVNVRRHVPWHRDSESGLRKHQRRNLHRLLLELTSQRYGTQYEDLASSLDEFLEKDEHCAAGDELSFSRRFQTWMAGEVADAISDRGKVLRLGRLVDSRQDIEHEYTGIFVHDANRAGMAGEHIFTASWDGKHEEIDKHVSLEVDVPGRNRSGVLTLEAKRWINGLVFFQGHPRRSVIFPWHPSLTV
ncbi:uncharacterized protein Z520_07530 [Fonsecaea multimorphosa CBS 102226]|uniref:Heterokaryon incompatibility domain-containing protein n=1 Tax=Fonsecaea multimorphosa CBS 102226 TaxID=1442371 RepID=A0A0D2H4Q5_9EURO|nr:uncharacterized protein Z520_07530 [Fonsecaea multimorphosa CBS 102226]KIX96810.1 hypothetical protein Z520_07530 [Fonsecaea multimorphosa CBS 102226]